MTKPLTILSLLLFFTNTIVAQNNWHKESDSLELLLAKEKTDTGKIEIYISLNGILLSNQPKKAFEYAMQALKLAEDIRDTFRIVRCMLVASDFYTQMGEYSASLENSYHALDLSGYKKSMLTLCHNRIANAYSYLKNYHEAVIHHHLSINLDKDLGDTSNISIDYCNLGGCFANMGIFDSALFYLRKANNRVIRLSGHPDPYSLSQLGNVFVKMKNFDSAIYYHFLAYKYDSLGEEQYEMAMDEYYIGNTYFKMHKYTEAKVFTTGSIVRSLRINQPEIPLNNYEILCTIYREEGNYKKALEYSLAINSLKDSMRIINREAIILGLETKYKFNVQENKLKTQELEMQLLERQKSLLIVLSLISFLFIISLIIGMILNFRKQKANRELMLQLKIANDAKESLISVISHDLRGSVGTLRSAAKAISEGMTDLDDSRNLLESFYPIADSTYDLWKTY
jgi:tetratricopeptide (TPR) repeat protein